MKRIAEKYADVDNCLYLGRQYLYPVALEGALKLKEISYIHAEGYPAAEMKHGPIALVDEHTPSVFLVPRGSVFDKVMSNLEEIKARGGPVIAVGSEGDGDVAALADDVIPVPDVPEYLQPLVSGDPAAAAGLPHRPAARLRRGQAAQPGEERDGGVTSVGRDVRDGVGFIHSARPGRLTLLPFQFDHRRRCRHPAAARRCRSPRRSRRTRRC